MSKMYNLIQGDKILAEVHNDIQTNGVFFSKPTLSEVGSISIYDLEDFVMEQTFVDGIKLKLLIAQTATKSQVVIRINGNTYNVDEQFIAGNVYNLVYSAGNFIVEKSGGGSGPSLSEITDFIFPIGSIYTTADSDFDPNGVFSGTWNLIAPGRVLVGVDENDTSFSTPEATGGLKTISLSISNIPTHTHTITNSGTHTHTMETLGAHQHGYTHTHQMVHNHDFATGYLRTALQRSSNGTGQAAGGNNEGMQLSGFTPLATGGNLFQVNMNSYTGNTTSQSNNITDSNGAHAHSIYNSGDHTHTIGNTGSGAAISNLQPYYTVFFWKRIL